MAEDTSVVMKTEAHGYTPRRGKVRDIYDLGDKLLLVATDRLSALDWVFPNGIPSKGHVLTSITEGWIRRLASLTEVNHLVSTDPSTFPKVFQRPEFEGRSMLCWKADRVFPFECIVRGYLDGSAWAEYQRTGWVCGIQLPEGIQRCAKLAEPIFTPSTKAETGHDVNVPFERMRQELGARTANHLRDWSLEIYEHAHGYALERGIIIADTKFEFGMMDRHPTLIDELLTPDSSRFWPADTYRPGGPQQSLDKQPVRDWLNGLPESVWDRKSSPPPLPEEQVRATRQRYLAIHRLLNNGKGLQ
ncbi:MAG: phosphoribosylaminoimidazolesuccinocarboxamide synthase [Candidatus Staskawiczbacteria bacterium]|jgi:phosphoribosylaminoimidazole-succinocarboxamide synthase